MPDTLEMFLVVPKLSDVRPSLDVSLDEETENSISPKLTSCASSGRVTKRAVLDSIVNKNDLDYQTPLELGTQTWFNGRLRFLVAGNYGNNTGVNDTIYFLPENMGDLDDLASLYLEWNRISELHASFYKMSNLFSLYINNNIIN